MWQVCVGEREKERERKREKSARVFVCVPNDTAVPALDLHENTCLHGQVLPAKVARSGIELQQSWNRSVAALLQLCCEQILPAELARSVSCNRAATELQQSCNSCNRAARERPATEQATPATELPQSGNSCAEIAESVIH